MDCFKTVNQCYFEPESAPAPRTGQRSDAYRGCCETSLTYHAKIRAQQRSVPVEAIEMAIDFGTPRPAGNGACEFFLGRREIRAARKAGVDLRAYEGTTVVTTVDLHVLSTYHADRPTKRREV